MCVSNVCAVAVVSLGCPSYVSYVILLSIVCPLFNQWEGLVFLKLPWLASAKVLRKHGQTQQLSEFDCVAAKLAKYFANFSFSVQVYIFWSKCDVFGLALDIWNLDNIEFANSKRWESDLTLCLQS